MIARAKFRIGLAAKLALCVIASTAAFFLLFGYINLRMERSHSEQLVKQAADRVADIILRSTRYEMLHNDREALVNIIQELGSEPGIQRIRVFNQNGRVTLSTDQAEIGTVAKPGEGGIFRQSQRVLRSRAPTTIRRPVPMPPATSNPPASRVWA